MPSALLLLHAVGGVHGLLQVAQIVQTVKDTDDVDAVGDGLLHESVHHIIGVRPVA